jgi:hypothetical protein
MVSAAVHGKTKDHLQYVLLCCGCFPAEMIVLKSAINAFLAE